MLGLLRLPALVQSMVLHKQISMGHARVLSKLEDISQIEYLANKIVKDDLSVRELEKIASDDYKRVLPINRRKNEHNTEYNHIENAMSEKLGTKVIIAKHKIHISFSSNNDLNRILDVLKININE
jgi:ParB family chromosome partitioning protein